PVTNPLPLPHPLLANPSTISHPSPLLHIPNSSPTILHLSLSHPSPVSHPSLTHP
ncbi:predicted protein, partial [Nematostella vectensis]